MKFRRCDDLCQLLHVRGLDIDDVEALILDIEIPKIYPQVVGGDESLAIAVDGYAVDVISVSVRVDTARNGSNDGIVVGHSREFEIGYAAEVVAGISHGTAAVRRWRSRRS